MQVRSIRLLVLPSALLSLSLLGTLPGGAATLCVKHDAPGPAHDGATWSTAYTSVQPALDAASAGDEVWVARGAYTGAITMKTGVSLYGGFRGDETTRAQRDVQHNETVLDGTTYQAGHPVAASTVTIPADATSATVLDGFTITKGTGTDVLLRPEPEYRERRGGGVYALGGTPIIRNNRITGNAAHNDLAPATIDVYNRARGGGIFVQAGSPRIEANTITENIAHDGGAIFVLGGSTQIIRNRLTDNLAVAYTLYPYYPDGNGGAIFAWTPISVIGNVVARNDANGMGAAMYVHGATVLNNTIVHHYPVPNDMSIGGTLFFNHSSGTPTKAVNNVIAYNSVAYTFFGSQNGSSVGANYVYGNGKDDNGDILPPRFVDADAGDYHLRADSPCVDTGDDAYLATVGSLDIDGEARKTGARSDYGADEFIPTSGRAVWATPPTGARANISIRPAPVVKLLNGTGQTMTSYNGPVTLAIQPGTGAEGEALAGNTVLAVNGVATFSSLSVPTAGNGYVLIPVVHTLYGEAYPADAAAPIDILPGAVRLAFETQPAGSTPRVPFDPAPVLAAVDEAGEVVPEFTGPITLSLKAETAPAGTVLSGADTVDATGGRVVFDRASINIPGTGYVLVATNPLLGEVESEPVTIGYSGPIKVRADGDDSNHGATWAAAFRTVQAALDAAGAEGGGEVWVAAGTYTERLTVKVPTALYGGFAGTETDRAERDIVANPTVLDGGGQARVMTVPNAIGEVVIDGVTIRNGAGDLFLRVVSYPPFFYYDLVGGGLASFNNDVTLSRVTFHGNVARGVIMPEIVDGMGYGAFLLGGQATVRACRFEKQQAGDFMTTGGALVLEEAVATVEGCRFIENGLRGLIAKSGKVTVRNNLFLRNQLGALRLNSGSVENNTFVGNTGEELPQRIVVQASNLVNNLIAFNQGGVLGADAIRNNCVFANEGGNWVFMDDPTGTNGNITADPLFVDRAADDLRLQVGSPCIDAGDDGISAPGGADSDGNPRKMGVHIDIGALEYLAPGAFTFADARRALRLAAGLEAMADGDARLGQAAAPDMVEITDALAILRKAAGFDTNPYRPTGARK